MLKTGNAQHANEIIVQNMTPAKNLMQQQIFWVERKFADLYFLSIFLRDLLDDLKDYSSPAAICAPTICILKPMMQHNR